VCRKRNRKVRQKKKKGRRGSIKAGGGITRKTLQKEPMDISQSHPPALGGVKHKKGESTMKIK